MSFFSSYVRRKAFNFAVSQLGLFDQDAFDLDKQGITVGTTTVLELRDVPLSTSRLAELLKLPSHITLTESRVLALRLTLPLNLLSNNIAVEIEGVKVKLLVVSEEQTTTNTGKDGKQGLARGVKANFPRTSSETNYEEPGLLTPEDLAKSFLAGETDDDKAHMKSAILEDQQSRQYASPDDTDDIGLGPNVSLMALFTNMTRGIFDGFEAVIKDIQIETLFRLPLVNNDGSTGLEEVTFCLDVRNIDIPPVSNQSVDLSNEKEDGTHPMRARNISITGIHGSLLSTSALSSFMTQLTRSPSPALSRVASKISDKPLLSFSSRSRSPPDTSPQSSISNCQDSSVSISSRIVASDALRGASNRTRTLPSKSSDSSASNLRESAPGITERRLPAEFGLDSQDLSASDIFDIQSEPAPLHRFGSNINDSALDQDLGSSLSRSPSRGGSISAASSTEVYKLQDSRLLSGESPDEPQNTSSSMIQDEMEEDLTQSKYFSDEEARSIYMSAMDLLPDESSNLLASPKIPVRLDVVHGEEQAMGNSKSAKSIASSHTTPLRASMSRSRRRNTERQHQNDFSDDDSPPVSLLASVQVDEPIETSSTSLRSELRDSQSATEISTPTLQPQPAAFNASLQRLVKTILVIDKITIQLPPASASAFVEDSTPVKSGITNIPGAFSMHESVSSTNSAEATDVQGREVLGQKSMNTPTVSIKVASMVISFDMALIRLAILVAGLLPSKQKMDTDTTMANNEASTQFSQTIIIQEFVARFENVLRSHARYDVQAIDTFESQAFDTNSQDLLRFILIGVKINQNQYKQHTVIKMAVRKASFGFPDENILSFAAEPVTQRSDKDLKGSSGHEISAEIVQHLVPSKPEIPMLQIDVHTAPLQVNINIKRLAEALEWLGGLSTVLELGSSMRSTVTITKPPSPSVRTKQREVRFAVPNDSSEPETPKSASTRIGIHIRGLSVHAQGAKASILFQSSLFGVVSQDGCIRARISHIKVSGPNVDEKLTDPPMLVLIEQIKVNFLEFPEKHDLERLLSLLSPSAIRDELDEDVLIDTLLRQRRKGAVLRVDVKAPSAHITGTEMFKQFSAIGEELSQLSSVTKYLPEDDKPGLLILIGAEQLKIDLNINERIRGLMVVLERSDIALVTFPSLLVASIGDVTALHENIELIGQATPYIQNKLAKQILPISHSPKLNFKYIAGEMEPTLRIKLYNIRFEYYVTTVMTMLGLGETAAGNVVVAEMVNTVANLAALDSASSDQINATSRGSKSQKPLRLAVTMRDTIIGLNPRGKAAQALLVLTKCRFSMVHADDQSSLDSGELEIAKASMMLIDDKKNLFKAKEVADSDVVIALGPKPTQLQCLQAVGYVSVGQVSSAKIRAQLKELDEHSQLDLSLSNSLLILETCADSTQTLLAVMGGLAPPLPPQQGPKYRTEIMTIQDMLSSFSGDAFVVGSDASDSSIGTEHDEPSTVLADDFDENLLDSELEPGYESVASNLGGNIYGYSSNAASEPRNPTTDLREEVHVEDSIHIGEKHYDRKSGPKVREWNSVTKTWNFVKAEKIMDSPMRIYLEKVHFIWNMFEGYDWKTTREAIARTVDEVEDRAEERRAARIERLRNVADNEDEEVIGDMLFNSIYIGVAARQDPRELRANLNGIINDNSSGSGSYATTTTQTTAEGKSGPPKVRKKRLRLERSRKHRMTIEVTDLSGQIISFPPSSGETQNILDIRLHNLEIFDNLPTSTWRKFVTGMQAINDRPYGESMIRLELMTVKPDPELLASEFVLDVRVLPLRLHVDQDALDFLTRFFEFRHDGDTKPSPAGDLPFVQRAVVGPIDIKLDFKPKRVDWWALRSGKRSEMMNFAGLEKADIRLRKIRTGEVHGFDQLGRMLNDIWTNDVIRNQLPGIVASVGPLRSIVDVGRGMVDLVVVPMEEYKRDGRLIRAIQKGVLRFSKNTTTELTKLGSKVAMGTHTMLSNVETLLVPEDRRPPAIPGHDTTEEQSMLSAYANQPIGVRQGLRGAYRGLERDLIMAKDAIIAIPGEIMDSDTASGAAVAFARTAPTIVLRPAMGVTRAIGQTLMGATNSLDKNERRRIEDKYKHR